MVEQTAHKVAAVLDLDGEALELRKDVLEGFVVHRRDGRGAPEDEGRQVGDEERDRVQAELREDEEVRTGHRHARERRRLDAPGAGRSR